MQATKTLEARPLPIHDLGAFCELRLVDSANWVDLILREAQEPTLRIWGPRETTARYRCQVRDGRLHIFLGGGLFDRIVDAFTTSLTRKHVRVELDVVDLKRVVVKGMVRIDRSQLSTIQPRVEYVGPIAGWYRPYPMR